MKTALLGMGLTLLVVLADQVGLLTSLENWAYDRRAAACQRFTPPPTTQLVHVDIDDSALETVGRWPWARATLAEIIQEMVEANPKAVALDLLTSEPEKIRQPDGRSTASGGDALYAAALARGRGSIVAVDFALGQPRPLSKLLAAALDELVGDVSLDELAVVNRLRAKGFDAAEAAGQLEQNFFRIRREAVVERVRKILATGHATLAQVKAALLPGIVDFNVNTPAGEEIERQYERVSAMQAAVRLGAPATSGASPLTKAAGFNLVPIEEVSLAAGAEGFVNFRFLPGGVVRSMPLVIESEGRIYPQLGLALACRMLDVQPSSLRFDHNHLIVPLPGAADIDIPVRSQFSSVLNREAYGLLDIPWFGSSAWDTTYDYPRHRLSAQHVSIRTVWNICATRHRIVANNRNIDAAVSFMLNDDVPGKIAMDPGRAKAYLAHLPPMDDAAARKEIIAFTLAQLKESGWLGIYASQKDADFDENARMQRDNLLRSKASLERAADENERYLVELREQRALLRSKLADKAVLVGWTGTGVDADFVPTSLHEKCPGVVIHGAIFNAVMTRHFWKRAPGWVTVAVTLAVGLVAAFAASGLNPSRAAVVAVLLAAGYIVFNGTVLFDHGGFIVGLSSPVVAVALVWTGCTLARVIAEGKQRTLITRRFSNYADPMLVDYLVEHPEQARFEGQVRELTVVFTDLQGFTSISEQLGERSVTLLNRYLGIMVPIIRRHKGYVNKFLGDGIMFFFGAPYENPGHASAALRSVLEMQAAMTAFNAELKAAGLSPLVMRAGVSTGQMVVGDAGSLNPERSDYTVLGDCVNLGARLESGNKAVGTRMLANGRARELGGNGLLLPAHR